MAPPRIGRRGALFFVVAVVPTFFVRALAESCTAPTGVENADPRGECAEGDIIADGGFCTARCTERFYPSVDRIQCYEGKLAFDTFVCVGKPCKQPLGLGYIEHAHRGGKTCREGWTVPHGTNCTTMCDTGYHPLPQVLSCEYGVLSPPTFYCSGPCKPPANVPNGRVKAGKILTCSEGSEIIHGKPCTALCSEGYVAKPNQLDCLYGNLTPPTFSCEGASCVEPGSIPNAALYQCAEGLSMPHGGTCTSQCAVGYAPSVPVLQCRFGALNPPRFECMGTPCTAPTGIERSPSGNGSSSCVEGDIIKSGGICTSICKDGYVPTAPVLRCELGILKPEIFRCVSAFETDQEARQLLSAAMVSEVSQVQDQLWNYGDISKRLTDKRGAGGSTALHVGALQGHQKLLAVVLAARADPNAEDDRGWTPLHVGAVRGHVGIVDELLKSGAKALARNRRGQTPRELAMEVAARAALGELAAFSDDLARSVSGRLANAERRETDGECLRSGNLCPAPEGYGDDEAMADDNGSAPEVAFLWLANETNASNGSHAAVPLPPLAPDLVAGNAGNEGNASNDSIGEVQVSNDSEVTLH